MSVLQSSMSHSLESSNNESSECFVWGGLYRFMRTAQILGIAPVCLEKHRERWRVRVSTSVYFLEILLIISIDLAMIAPWFIKLIWKETLMNDKSVSVIALLSHYLLAIGSANVIVFRSLTRQRQIVQSLNQLHKVQMTFFDVYHKSTEKDFVLLSLSGIAILVSIISGFLLYGNTIITEPNLTLGIMYRYPILNIAQWDALIIVTLFTWIATEVHSTFKAINDQLDNILQIPPNQLRKPRYLESVTIDESIRHLSLMFVFLCDVVLLLDSTFGLDLLIFLMVNFMQFLRLNYFIAMSLFVKWTSVYNLVMYLTYVGMFGLWHVNSIESSYRTLTEIDRTNHLVTRLVNKYTDLPISVELKKFSQYLTLNRVAYSPMGIFTLSRSLITTMTTNVISYLVIVIQFESMGNAGN